VVVTSSPNNVRSFLVVVVVCLSCFFIISFSGCILISAFGLSNPEKRRDLLTPLNRHWYAFNGTLSGTPDVGVLQTASVA